LLSRGGVIIFIFIYVFIYFEKKKARATRVASWSAPFPECEPDAVELGALGDHGRDEALVLAAKLAEGARPLKPRQTESRSGEFPCIPCDAYHACNRNQVRPGSIRISRV
jgi:hypothetical protein